jgi:hypothetical protein
MNAYAVITAGTIRIDRRSADVRFGSLAALFADSSLMAGFGLHYICVRKLASLRIPAEFRNLADCGVFIAESFNRMADPFR